MAKKGEKKRANCRPKPVAGTGRKKRREKARNEKICADTNGRRQKPRGQP